MVRIACHVLWAAAARQPPVEEHAVFRAARLANPANRTDMLCSACSFAAHAVRRTVVPAMKAPARSASERRSSVSESLSTACDRQNFPDDLSLLCVDLSGSMVTDKRHCTKKYVDADTLIGQDLPESAMPRVQHIADVQTICNAIVEAGKEIVVSNALGGGGRILDVDFRNLLCVDSQLCDKQLQREEL
mmetsp:Transcript_17704/g.45547  ORF Transcript_17704/g.45547 Transcript_17704/m.45547 type:complete len:189 (+) Transcript_17704:29-595(+)